MGHLSRYLRQYSHETFSSLYVRNYRLYYIGQIISTSGTFMQSVAQAWLVLELTNSGTALGIATALQYLPILVLGPYGGVIADRFSKRKILYFTQSLSGILALILGVLGGNRPGKGLDGLYPGLLPGHGHRLRQPHPPDLIHRIGRTGATSGTRSPCIRPWSTWPASSDRPSRRR